LIIIIIQAVVCVCMVHWCYVRLPQLY